jgi:hypothetical protein
MLNPAPFSGPGIAVFEDPLAPVIKRGACFISRQSFLDAWTLLGHRLNKTGPAGSVNAAGRSTKITLQAG